MIFSVSLIGDEEEEKVIPLFMFMFTASIPIAKMTNTSKYFNGIQAYL